MTQIPGPDALGWPEDIRWTLDPFVGLGPLRFGDSRADVAAKVGAPSHVRGSAKANAASPPLSSGLVEEFRLSGARSLPNLTFLNDRLVQVTCHNALETLQIGEVFPYAPGADPNAVLRDLKAMSAEILRDSADQLLLRDLGVSLTEEGIWGDEQPIFIMDANEARALAHDIKTDHRDGWHLQERDAPPRRRKPAPRGFFGRLIDRLLGRRRPDGPEAAVAPLADHFGQLVATAEAQSAWPAEMPGDAPVDKVGVCDTPDAFRAALGQAADPALPVGRKHLLETHIRPVIYLTGLDDASDPAGATRFGGLPDLPRGVDWPQRSIVPEEDPPVGPLSHSFLGQLDLAALADLPGYGRDMPREGRLLLFFNFEVFDDGQNAACVIWDRSDPDRSKSAKLPRDLRRAHKEEISFLEKGDAPVSTYLFDAVPLTARTAYRLPTLASMELDAPQIAAALDDDSDHTLTRTLERVEDLTHDNRFELHAIVASGIDPLQDHPHRAAADQTGIPAHDWTYLCQINLDYISAGQTDAHVFFSVPTADLREGRFDRAWAELQAT